MDNLRKILSDILEEGTLMSLGTLDEDGVWVADLNYVHDDDLNIYWLSYVDTRHSIAISKDNKVAASITISNGKGDANKGVQIRGVARKIDTEIKEIADKHRQKRGKKAVPESQTLLDRYESWYMLRPISVDIVHEELFGQHKRKLNLDEK